MFIQPGIPWENGYVESFNGSMRDELLNGEILDTLLEAQVIVGQWVKDYNTFRPHSVLGYQAPAPKAVAYPALLPIAGLVTRNLAQRVGLASST